ncbi:MAG: hypothetical protein DI586_07485 [Micavibrio aeruginosavorus]|uniref:Uncharacterized protein n=1 Tax=Micavibrio aeruginosavorus TaxID=349221 RepID=A0A2W5FH42_9BACT|nr:MAG: hypothetical protein DI586_07485 [Micavibrio aeruginosavorus]
MSNSISKFNSGVFHASDELIEDDQIGSIMAPIGYEKPQDWDGKNTYNPDHLPQDWDGRNKPSISNNISQITPPPVTELPADWDGKNTYNPDHLPQDWDGKNKPEGYVDPIKPVTPPYTPELPADWDGKNTYNPDHLPQDWDGRNKPSVGNGPTEVTPPPVGYEKPADWDGKNTYNPQTPAEQKLSAEGVLDMDANEIDHLLQSNFGSDEPESTVSNNDPATPSAPSFIGFDDAHLQIKSANGDF